MKTSHKNLATETLKTKLTTLQGTAKIDCLIELANRSMLYSKYQTGLEYAKQAHELAVQAKTDKQIANALMQIAAFHLHKINSQEAKNYYFKALELYQKTNDSMGEANCHYKLGVYFWIQSENEKSIEHLQAALDPFQELAEKREISTCLTYLGRNLAELNQFDAALNYYFDALEILRASKNHNSTIKLLNEIGDAYFELEQYDESLWYFEEALLLLEKSPNKYLENDVLYRIGKTYYANKKYETATAWFERNLTLANQINDHVSEERIANYLFRSKKNSNKINEKVHAISNQNLTFLNSNVPSFDPALFAKAS